jgi:microcystin-dependent protein
MAEPYLGEIRIFGFGFAPTGWALCNGQTVSISQNAALFAIIGTFYGGNGTSTFQLPNLQGSVPMHQGTLGGNTYVIGEVGGETSHTLSLNEYPTHNHSISGETGARTVSAPGGAVLASGDIYGLGPPTGTLASQAVGIAGGSQPHQNMQPYLAMNFCIALQGIFPSRN